MRKIFLGALAAIIVLSADVGTAFAAEARSGCYFVDADGDGVCDNAGSMCAYVDADGDGVCDHYAAGQGRGNGQGRGSKRGSQCGRGRCGR